ncbi:MAG: tryptophan synthase subunit beta, partial [Acidimicrobiia bacterium]|nr:tryptophan synthase subunit beta [Acidimicrobiia bacterium]
MTEPLPDADGRFGQFGGRYAPETLMGALSELDEAFTEAWADPAFVADYRRYLTDYVGRPSP